MGESIDDKGADGTTGAGAVSATDLTARRRYGSILDQLREGFQVVDRQWRYLYVNDAVVAHARRTRSELVGRTMMEVYPGIERTDMFGALERCMRTGSPAQLENHFTYPDGSTAWFELRVAPVPEGLVILSLDITERKKLAAQLRQAQRLEVAGRLASSVAHDFNNYLTAITGSCMIARQEIPQGTDAFEDLDVALAAADGAARLVRQLLAFCRERDVAPQLVDLDERISEMSAMLERAMRNGGTLRLALGAAPKVRLDVAAFEQIVLNLVVNAHDAMPDGGTVVIRTGATHLEQPRTIGIDELSPGRYATLTVSDDGVGMDAATMAHIFEPFFTTKPEGQGTGLGLATCYGNTRQAGGAIAVTSEPGRGTTFTIYLPAAG